ncbi:MGMT family protein [Thalassolituus hydrocarboniclasticus]|uniref:MGMT family protein n=1 Tax=Thalassolituus hydrocarboniclasticus TaxID=2742796 RepID=A0ABY6ACA9_9GAMM|nr:MGMT family protein [Thalassolituus hydrocarboniclasticus]UXD88377.1 MGMT family protein [Thalassolituus hydrocarboniclasticus]
MTNIRDNSLQQLYTALAGIPPGKVVTYGQLAALAGRPAGARWAGRVLSQLPKDTQLPWHRVINAQGRISFPPDSAAFVRQQSLLLAEGVEFSASGRICFKRFGLN